MPRILQNRVVVTLEIGYADFDDHDPKWLRREQHILYSVGSEEMARSFYKKAINEIEAKENTNG